MRHRKKDMEVMLDRLQNDLDVLQASFNDLETDCTNKQHQLNNLQDKVSKKFSSFLFSVFYLFTFHVKIFLHMDSSKLYIHNKH